ncbi:hypothetical protein C0993_007989 [Termitomyces sp. T159_Od127]|nr:hypothetical protein C0993_007989 [Termitomyces sp. T159_Od127]
MFQAKPLTFQLESSQVAFATLYLQGIAFNHYMSLLQFDSNSLVLLNWQVFAQKFSSNFDVFDIFTTFIVHFEKEAYKTSWNYNALWFALYHTLPQHIKDILCLAPKQPNYNSYKALVTQINQQYWKDCSEYLAPQVPWNSFRNSNWQTRATTGNQTFGTALPSNFVTQPPLGQGPANANQPLGLHSLTQLNATNTQEALNLNHTDPNVPQDPHNTPDFENNKEALCMNGFSNWPWIDVLKETQEWQQCEGACILYSEQGHFINESPKHQAVGQAV